MTDLEFIKKFSKIRISNICKNLKISTNNVYTGKAKKEKIKQIRNEIYKELSTLLVDGHNEQ